MPRTKIADGRKCCTKCGRWKPLAEFTSDTRKSSGRSSHCKGCQNVSRSAVREKTKVRQAKWYMKNRGRAQATQRRYKTVASAAYRRYQNKYRAKNRKHINAQVRRRARVDPRFRERQNTKARNRYALQIGSNDQHNQDDIFRILVRQRRRCVYCLVDLGEKYEVDHIKPLSRGGSNGKQNLQILCGPCNRSKRDKLPEDYEREIGFKRAA
jgi:5-methylcytosine-specific restriction endonuclease McrA